MNAKANMRRWHGSSNEGLRAAPRHGAVCEAGAKSCAELGDSECAELCQRRAESCHAMKAHPH